MSTRPAWVAVGLPFLVGCFGHLGPLEIEIRPVDLTTTIPGKGSVTHLAHISSYSKLIDECGLGTENVDRMYERRVAGITDRDQRVAIYGEILDSVLNKAAVGCLEKKPDLIPKECRHRMVALGGEHGRNFRAVVAFQCGESAILPLEVAIEPLDPAKRTKSSPVWGTHLATYSNLDKLLDECGSGAEKARTIAFQSESRPRDAFGRIVDDALIKCLEKRNLIPEECRNGMVPVHNVPVRSFEPKVHFRCEKSADSAS